MIRRLMLAIWGAAAILAPACAATAGVMVPVAGDPVAIDSGRVAGTMLPSGVKAYLGVPFAAPPVRENRWRAPQPVAPWSGVYTADAFKPECVQSLRSASINHYFGEEALSEDCLYLNIWAPGGVRPSDMRPVVVWIYGGAFSVGSAASAIYSGEPLAKKGVIYVAANYRLGVFGFLAHPDLTAESGHNASGDWGFLDQVAALQWVRRNIAAFGGDPDNVTLVGQSAGAMSINDLQASPLARGLFQRVFAMSGATVQGGPADALGAALKDAEATGVALQQVMKASSLAEMRAASWDKVFAAAQQARLRVGPDVDGYYLPDTPQHIFEAGRQTDVPVVTGSTADDIGTAPPLRSARTLADYRRLAVQSYGDKAEAFLKLWPAVDDASAARQAEQVGRSSGFGQAARAWARLQAGSGRQPAYLFMVSRVQPFTPGVRFSDFNPATAGAYHMSDVPYFLGTYEAFNLFRRTRDWTALDRTLSDKMQNVIVAYATTGVPSTPEVKMVRYDPSNEQRTLFGDVIGVERLNTPAMDFLLNTPAAPAAPQAAPPGARPTF